MPDGWEPDKNGLMPDFFAGDAKLLSIDASNMEQYQDRLSVGTIEMMKKYGYRIDVYPTHRTAAAPQWVYDYTYQNALNTQMDANGAKYGFTGAYGGTPFPILDTDPNIAGAQAMWNHQTRWQGTAYTRNEANYVVDSTGALTLSAGQRQFVRYPYYMPGGSASNYSGLYIQSYTKYIAPANQIGQEFLDYQPTNMFSSPERVWAYMPGEGRVREEPDMTYDTPAPGLSGYINQDEYDIFRGSMDRYDWKLIGKKEMYTPYNNNKLYLATPQEGHGQHFINPDLLRWELHRVWIVEATLSPGKRNVMAKRRFYIDEDTWTVLLGDTWDAEGNYWHFGVNTMENRPDFPAGVLISTTVIADLQANHYLSSVGIWNESPYNQPVLLGVPPQQLFDARSMAAQAQF
ncbi:hypothetical protein GCM10010909_07590 [Acidocella aquatica]|uniref:Outer membrane lipoprotein-sorting protein n=2 Tax=Acidocella aquatica TaxID=1922313 RepID=A0ABQ6A0W6_9PROT|nr:hypothetical protein GCM10010909_07590 [Acidocella aquatica]